MPIHDFVCDPCKESILDRYQSRLDTTPPACPKCAQPMERIFSTSRSHTPFKEFTVDVDGKTRTFTSLSEVRAYERQSLASGSPSIFREFSQNPGNRDANVFGKPSRDSFSTRNRRGVPYITKRGTHER